MLYKNVLRYATFSQEGNMAKPPAKKTSKSTQTRAAKPAKEVAIVTSIRLMPSIKQALERAAVADDRTTSWLITKIVSDWLKDNKYLK
jgi:hypothetical protein